MWHAGGSQTFLWVMIVPTPSAGGPRMESEDRSQDADLETFVTAYLPRLRAALRALGGPEQVDEAVAETLLHLSRQPERVMSMDNPRGYLYRVARSKLRNTRRTVPNLPPVPAAVLPEIEPRLSAALASLPQRQRAAVYLMAGLGVRPAREVGDVLGIAPEQRPQPLPAAG